MKYALSLLLVLALGAATYWWFVLREPGDAQVMCTQEAKQCPDGSFVGRVGPDCSFAPCPSE